MLTIVPRPVRQSTDNAIGGREDINVHNGHTHPIHAVASSTKAEDGTINGRKHRALRPSPAAIIAGTAASQAAKWYSQRGANAQPGGRSARSGGPPGIEARRFSRCSPFTTERNNPAV